MPKFNESNLCPHNNGSWCKRKNENCPAIMHGCCSWWMICICVLWLLNVQLITAFRIECTGFDFSIVGRTFPHTVRCGQWFDDRLLVVLITHLGFGCVLVRWFTGSVWRIVVLVTGSLSFQMPNCRYKQRKRERERKIYRKSHQISFAKQLYVICMNKLWLYCAKKLTLTFQ